MYNFYLDTTIMYNFDAIHVCTTNTAQVVSRRGEQAIKVSCLNLSQMSTLIHFQLIASDAQESRGAGYCSIGSVHSFLCYPMTSRRADYIPSIEEKSDNVTPADDLKD